MRIFGRKHKSLDCKSPNLSVNRLIGLGPLPSWWDNHRSIKTYVELGMDLGTTEPNRRSDHQHSHHPGHRGRGLVDAALRLAWFSLFVSHHAGGRVLAKVGDCHHGYRVRAA